jgi:predicted Abi (CAAX) family protease
VVIRRCFASSVTGGAPVSVDVVPLATTVRDAKQATYIAVALAVCRFGNNRHLLAWNLFHVAGWWA